jgi:hypothetical protein
MIQDSVLTYENHDGWRKAQYQRNAPSVADCTINNQDNGTTGTTRKCTFDHEKRQ